MAKHQSQFKIMNLNLLESKASYVNAAKHGLEQWREEGGQKWKEVMWRNGKHHGVDSGWYENDRKKWEEMWRADKLHGVGIWWHENGKKWQEIYYLNNEEYARIECDEEGNVIKVDLPTLTPTINPLSKLKNHTKKLVS